MFATSWTLAPEVHLYGKTVNDLDEDQRAKLARLSQDFGDSKELVVHYEPPENFLIRQLEGRRWDVEQARQRLQQALSWRAKHPVHHYFAIPKHKYLNREESSTAKHFCDESRTAQLRAFSAGCGRQSLRVTGVDQYGRAVLVMSTSRENEDASTHDIMEFVGWLMEHARRTMDLAQSGRNEGLPVEASKDEQEPAQKMCVFIHLTDFSIFNAPKTSLLSEVIKLLNTVYPELLGTCVLLNPPLYFLTVWSLISFLLDEKTISNIVMVSGDLSRGSQNDELLCRVIGPSWRRLTACDPKEGYWLDVEAREVASFRRFIPKISAQLPSQPNRLVTGASPATYNRIPNLDRTVQAITPHQGVGWFRRLGWLQNHAPILILLTAWLLMLVPIITITAILSAVSPIARKQLTRWRAGQVESFSGVASLLRSVALTIPPTAVLSSPEERLQRPAVLKDSASLSLEPEARAPVRRFVTFAEQVASIDATSGKEAPEQEPPEKIPKFGNCREDNGATSMGSDELVSTLVQNNQNTEADASGAGRETAGFEGTGDEREAQWCSRAHLLMETMLRDAHASAIDPNGSGWDMAAVWASELSVARR